MKKKLKDELQRAAFAGAALYGKARDDVDAQFRARLEREP
jgi:hypothetical protein